MIRQRRGTLSRGLGSLALVLVSASASPVLAAGGGGGGGAGAGAGAGAASAGAGTGSNAGPGAPGSTGGTTSSVPGGTGRGNPSALGTGSPSTTPSTTPATAPNGTQTNANPNNVNPPGSSNVAGASAAATASTTGANGQPVQESATPSAMGVPASDTRNEPKAEGVLPEGAVIPAVLSLGEALRMFHQKGLDLLIADAQVRSAEGVETAAGAVLNPIGSFTYGRLLNYDTTTACGPGQSGCSKNSYTVGLSDNAAIEDIVSGKRELRQSVAHAALKAAKMARVDAERSIAFQVKAAYFQVVLAAQEVDFARTVAEGAKQSLDLTSQRYNKGAIQEGELAVIQTAGLEADQALDQARQNLRSSRVTLGFLLGVRGHVSDFDVERTSDKYAVPASLDSASQGALVDQAFKHRPDLVALSFQKERAAASIRLAKRQVVPDISIGAQYTQTGTNENGTQPPMLSVGITSGIPVFYQQQGEIRQAEADFDTQSLQRAKSEAQVVSDVENAYANYVTARGLLQRMEGQGHLLERAKFARDIQKKRYESGASSQLEFLDAQRTFIAVNVEYLTDLTNYWTAIAQLEQATGVEFRQ